MIPISFISGCWKGAFASISEDYLHFRILLVVPLNGMIMHVLVISWHGAGVFPGSPAMLYDLDLARTCLFNIVTKQSRHRKIGSYGKHCVWRKARQEVVWLFPPILGLISLASMKRCSYSNNSSCNLMYSSNSISMSLISFPLSIISTYCSCTQNVLLDPVMTIERHEHLRISEYQEIRWFHERFIRTLLTDLVPMPAWAREGGLSHPSDVIAGFYAAKKSHSFQHIQN